MKPETQDQPVAQESSLASPLSAPPACSSALAGLAQRLQAANLQARKWNDAVARLAAFDEIDAIVAAIRDIEARQCLMNAKSEPPAL